jgi:hydrogenase maturation protease
VIVIGVGNSWRGDDAAGLEVARRVGGVRHEGDCTRLLDEWDADDDVLLVDAVSSGAPAGTIHRFDAIHEPLPATLASSSTHAFGVPGAVELARALGRLPRRLRVVGIEGERWEAGAGLSAAVARAVDALAAEVGKRDAESPSAGK